jgi:putative heme-binding domain-containing protein
VYVKQQCVRCHGEGGKSANQRLGPDLAGAADRLSAADLFAEIVDPSRAVSPTYRTTAISTRDGHLHHGLVIYESPDGTLLQTAPDTLMRVTGDELLSMAPSDRSLMPDGLLQGLGDQEIADLYAYLRTLKAPQ